MGCGDKPYWLVPFLGFTEYTATMPSLYWNVDSQEQRIDRLCEQLHKLVCYANYLGEKINLNHDDIEALKVQFQKFLDGEMLDFYEAQIQAWIDENMERIIKAAIKMVFFGLTQEGYFVAYIPESWNEITFDTVMNYADENYGRLVLEYYVNNETETVIQP